MLLSETDKRIRYLYKYRSFDNNGHTLDLLRNNEFYLSYSTEFNDPFDCFVEYEIIGTKEECDNYIEWLKISDNKKREIYLQLKECNYDYSKVFKNNDYKDNEALLMCCFSTIPDNILLWSHYANKHKGICIGFKTSFNDISMGLKIIKEEINFKIYDFLPVVKMKYDKNMPKPHHLFNHDSKEIIPFFTTKAYQWRYEKEMRIILNKSIINKKTIKFQKSILSKIIFGIETLEKDKYVIYDIIKKHYLDEKIDVKFFQAIKKRHKYKLELVDLNI